MKNFHAVVYTRENCQPCKATKARLLKFGASFEEVEIDDFNVSELKSEGHMKAPVVKVFSYFDGEPVLEEVFTGFNVTKIDEYFSLKYSK